MPTKKTRKSAKTVSKRRRTKKKASGTRKKELVPVSAKAGTLLSRRKQSSLASWFELYMGIEAGDPDSNTFKAKQRDLQQFIDYLQTSAGTDSPDQWTKSVTESFLRHLHKKRQLAAATVNRALATLKHVAGWIHHQHPFLVGNPCEKVKNIDEDEPEWRGLEDIQVNRLRSAAEQLTHMKSRSNQNAHRDQALFLTLLHTGLRVSELLALDLVQFKDDAFHRIQRKGKKVTRKIRVPKPARTALNEYLKEVRGGKAGPLFQSRTGNRLAAQNVDDALKKIAAQANSTLPKKQHIHLSAHMLRHTCLRKAAEKDIRYAMKLSGHTSSQYIWRYTEPSADEFDEIMEDLYD